MSTQTSKFLSYVLRHAPDSIGITLDSQGWVAVDELLAKANAAGRALDIKSLKQVVATSDKKRFTFNEDMTRIRAAQGHSVKVDLGKQPSAPPVVLYHGTATRHLPAILQEGLKPMSRQKVHLSPDIETATKVGQRHGKPVVLRVDSRAMHEAGYAFWQADNGVWLTDAVSPEFLSQETGATP